MPSFRFTPCKRTLIVAALALGMAGCGGDGSSTPPAAPLGTDTPPTPLPAADNMGGRIYPLGTELVSGAELVVYAHALDTADTPVQIQEPLLKRVVLHKADGVTNIAFGDADVEVTPVAVNDRPGDPAYSNGNIISLSFVTDYSASIPPASLAEVEKAYSAILTSLPKVYQAQAIDFSQKFKFRTTATGEAVTVAFNEVPAVDPIFVADEAQLAQAVAFLPDTGFRRASALFNALGTAFFGPHGASAGNFGLLRQCTPVHLLVLYSDGENRTDDGKDYYSLGNTGTGPDLLPIIRDSNTVPVVLATETTATNLTTLQSIAGWDPATGVGMGAYIYDPDPAKMTERAVRFAQSLGNMVRIRITDSTGTLFEAGDELELAMTDTPTQADITVRVPLGDSSVRTWCANPAQ